MLLLSSRLMITVILVMIPGLGLFHLEKLCNFELHQSWKPYLWQDVLLFKAFKRDLMNDLRL